MMTMGVRSHPKFGNGGRNFFANLSFNYIKLPAGMGNCLKSKNSGGHAGGKKGQKRGYDKK